jgi:hypothetical protein
MNKSYNTHSFQLRVIYGLGPQKEDFLRVPDATEWVCRSDPRHVYPFRDVACPDCGGHLIERDRFTPSSLVLCYADRRGLTPTAALDDLESLQWLDPDTNEYYFGVRLKGEFFGPEGLHMEIGLSPLYEALSHDSLAILQGNSMLEDCHVDELGAKYHLIINSF